MRFFQFTVLTLLSLAIFSAKATPTDCQTISQFPALIDQPGNFCLDQSHNLQLTGTNPAITILSSNVDLDLRQHTLANFLAEDGFCLNAAVRYSSIGVLAHHVSNVEVRNGSLKCFSTAVEFGANGSCYDCNTTNRIRQLTIDTAWTFGIFVQGSRTVVEDNHVVGVGGNEDRVALGIHLQGSANTVRNNDVMRVFGDDNAGISVAVGYGNLVIGNRVQEANFAFRLYGGHGVRYRDNLTSNVSQRYSGQGTDLGNNH